MGGRALSRRRDAVTGRPRGSAQGLEYVGDGTVIKRIRGFTLIELLVVIAIIALLISILLPSLSRARELSKRLVCQSNMKGVGTSCKIYANDNYERWPVPPFNRSLPSPEGETIQYIVENYTDAGERHSGMVGMRRRFPSYSINPNASTQLSVTRAFWMLVRAGNVTLKQFICPSSSDSEDMTENIEIYYDFFDYGNISYGYQVPFGPRDTQPREGMDNRSVVMADKSPFYPDVVMGSNMTWETGRNGEEVDLEDAPKAWRRFNSPNHGGAGNGEGQVALFADGHASFERTPAFGIDHDNIYTLIIEEWGNPEHGNLIRGELPATQMPNPFPGMNAFGGDYSDYAATDTLIYP
ncbi:MAG: prepilin-type N-terminal cleavage/methylation domain-containing protein [Planctomycetes bacterium]|nr:prepilin-type N-terminal cleavage/methylation domain-containing protein [Planctomycetota bacterium]